MSDERRIRARLLRLGDQLFTRDGWQTIRGLLIFEDPDQVTVYTDQRDDDRTSGWSFALADHVISRPAPEGAGLDRPDRADVPAVGDIALSRPVTGDRDMSCPDWCIEHYAGGDRQQQTNHAGFPHSARVADVWTGEPLELGLWLERRDDRETGETETFGVLEVKRLASDVELTIEDMRYLAAKLLRLADSAEKR
jgi:hypothetical protein